MKYSIGQNLGDFGFVFLEKVHEPIFLITKLGKISNMNEAARKLVRIAKINLAELNQISVELVDLIARSKEDFKRLKVGSRGVQLIARNLRDSNFILVEVRK